jgi:hypothetical protein
MNSSPEAMDNKFGGFGETYYITPTMQQYEE